MNAMNKKRGLAGMVAVLFLGLAVLLLSACSDEMEVQQSYPFKVENMPVPTRIIKGETVEIRCELKRNCDRQFLTIRSHDGILVLRLVVEVKSQLVKLCRFAVVLKIDVNCLLIFAFRSVV